MSKFSDVERAVRELIREQMRLMGIEHTSSRSAITTISYAQTDTESIRYPGPLSFSYLDGVVYYIPMYPRAPVILPGNYFLKPAIRDSWTLENRLEIAAPDFVDQITSLLDRHIPIPNRSPYHYKLRLEVDKVLPIEKTYLKEAFTPRFIFPIIGRFLSFVFGRSSERHIWHEVIKRHYSPSAEELAAIDKTFDALIRQPYSFVRRVTDRIVEQNKPKKVKAES